MEYFRKDWILFEKIVTEGGKMPEELIKMDLKEDDVETNKHVPYIEELDDGYKVSIGKNELHPMTAEHHILFIDLFVDEKYAYRQHIKLGEKPVATFKVPKGKKVTAVEFCNLHGLYKNNI